MDETGKGSEIVDVTYVLLVVEYCLIEVGNAPTERNIVYEQLRQGSGSLGGVGVAPGTERNKYFLLLVECHVAVHHGADTDACEDFYFCNILFEYVCTQVGVAVLKSIPYSLYAVCPQSVHELVFPVVTALCYRLVLLIYEDSLDAGRAKLDAEDGFSLLDSFFCCHFFVIFGEL